MQKKLDFMAPFISNESTNTRTQAPSPFSRASCQDPSITSSSHAHPSSITSIEQIHNRITMPRLVFDTDPAEEPSSERDDDDANSDSSSNVSAVAVKEAPKKKAKLQHGIKNKSAKKKTTTKLA